MNAFDVTGLGKFQKQPQTQFLQDQKDKKNLPNSKVDGKITLSIKLDEYVTKSSK